MSDIPQFRRLYRALIDEMRNAGDHEYADKLFVDRHLGGSFQQVRTALDRRASFPP